MALLTQGSSIKVKIFQDRNEAAGGPAYRFEIGVPKSAALCIEVNAWHV